MESERSHTIEQMADVVHTALRAMHSRHNKQEFTQNCYLFQHPLTNFALLAIYTETYNKLDHMQNFLPV